MPNFGFSAYLRILSLNARPQRREVRQRLMPSLGGYDFHRSLRDHCRRFLAEGEDIPSLMASLEQITRAPERRSALAGFERLMDWRTANPGRIVQVDSATFESSRRLFKLRFEPTFGLVGERGVTAIHVWNTSSVQLMPSVVYGAMALFPEIYEEIPGAPVDLAVLSLPDRRLLRLSDVDDYATRGQRVAEGLEELILDLRDELGLPGADDDRARP